MEQSLNRIEDLMKQALEILSSIRAERDQDQRVDSQAINEIEDLVAQNRAAIDMLGSRLDRMETMVKSLVQGNGEEEVPTLAVPVTSIDWSRRAMDLFEREGIETLTQLVGRSRSELRGLKRVGNVTLNEIEAKLETVGLKLRSSAE